MRISQYKRSESMYSVLGPHQRSVSETSRPDSEVRIMELIQGVCMKSQNQGLVLGVSSSDRNQGYISEA